LGVMRTLSDAPDAAVDLLNSSNEFDDLLANAYDLRGFAATGETREIFPRFYIADFTNLVPQQLLPFQKLDTTGWLMETFYPDAPGGFSFGVISEAVVGLGWFDLVWRGAVVGWLFVGLHRSLLSSRRSFWKYGVYLWFMVMSFQTIRVGTFALVPRVFYELLVVLIVVKEVSDLLANRRLETLLPPAEVVGTNGIQ